jgi:glycerol-3-phosphate O-acyltransferase
MQAVGRVIPALPVSLVSTAMLGAGDKPLSLLDIKQLVSSLIGVLEAQGTYVHIPRADRDYAIAVGLRMLTLRHLVLEEDGSYRANPAELMLLKYYANAIMHLFESAAPPAE